MSRQTELQGVSEQYPFVFQKDYVFFMQCVAYDPIWHRCNYAPQNWKDSEYEILRSMEYCGISRKILTKTITFVKDSRDYLKNVYELVGINADVAFRVWKYNSKTFSWQTYFLGRIDMATYKISELGVEVQIVDSSFHEKIMNRIDTKVDIRRRDSLGGFNIPAFSSEDPQINMPFFNKYGSASWVAPSTGLSVGVTGTHHLPMDEQDDSDFPETQDQTLAGSNPYFAALTGSTQRGFTVNGQVVAEYTVGIEEYGYIRFYLNYGTTQVLLAEYDIDFPAGGTIDIDFSFTEQYALLPTQTAYLTVSVSQQENPSYQLTFSVVDVWLSGVSEIINGYEFTAYPFYEAFLRVCQLIGDKNDAFKSTFFGRTDTPIITYPSDGQLGHITKGYYIREKYAENNTLSLSLKDLFKCGKSLFQIGLGIENDSGTFRVRIEHLSYFFDATVILDLSDQIREESIEKEVIADLHYNEISIGYDSFEYERLGGLYEYNTKSLWATKLDAVKNKLELICPYRADASQIVNLALKKGEDEDVSGDEDVFIIDTVRDSGEFDIRTDEGFDDIDGGATMQKYFNVDWSPKRNLLRNGEVIRAGLNKYLGSYLKWQSLDKNTNLRSLLTAESTYVDEDEDQLVNDLEEPFYLPEKYIAQTKLTIDQIDEIEDNPYGVIKLSNDKHGWILSIKINNATQMATLEILRSNVTLIYS